MTDQASYAESREVNWQLDSTTVYGTLVRPDGPGPFPAVVMVAGSGPTDRDWNSPLLPGSNGSARLLAEALAQAGIASLRYDKRAAGPHARENMAALIGKMSMQSHVDELTGAVRTIVQHDFIRDDRIFALTNSEGALHALHYQVQRHAAGHEEMTFFFPENANHVLKQELRPRENVVPAQMAESYNGPDTRLDPQALASIREWLAAHA